MSNVTTLGYPLPYSGASSTQTVAATTYTSSFMPGAWLYNTNGSIPIYNSISNLNTNQYNFYNCTLIRVFPGYKAICYTTNNFGGTATTIDYSNNTYQIFTTVSNVISVRLYYQGIEIKNTIPKNIPYSITNSNSSNMLDQTGLLYYYKFDTDVVNYSSALNGNTYELSSAALTTSTTKLTSGSLAISLGGHFKVPGHKINPALGYSVALWYKLGTTTGAWSRVLDIAHKINTPSDILLGYPFVGSGLLYFSSYGGGIGDVNTSYIMDTNWHHVCITCSIKGYWTLYIDGVETPMAIRNNTPLPDYLNYWYINKSSYTADGNASCNVNQLLIFNREINPYEVYYLYQNPTTVKLGYMTSQISKTGLQYYYPLNRDFNDVTNSTLLEGPIDNMINNGIISSSSLYLSGGANTSFSIPPHYIGTNYSFSFHFKINQYPKRSFANIVNIGPEYNTNGGFRMYFSGYNVDVQNLQFIINGTPYGVNYSLALNTWINICVTFNNNEWKVYIDAILRQTVNTAITSALMNNWNFAPSGANSSLSDDPNTITTLNCNVKQLAIFSKTLALSEIQTLNNRFQPITISNLMYYYPFDNDFFDYSKITYNEGINNGTYTGISALDTSTTKMTLSSLRINSTGFFQVPSHYIPTNYSISFWIKLNSYATGPWSRLIDFSSAKDGPISVTGGPILYFPVANSGNLGFTPSAASSNYYDLYTMDLNWHHITITYSNSTWILYVDGTSVFTTTYTASSNLLNYCYIGRSNWAVDASTTCNVNQLAIFNKTLSLSEIQTLYNNPTQPITISNLMYYYPFDKNFFDYSQIGYIPANVGIDNSTHTNIKINSGDGRNNGTYTGITGLDTTTIMNTGSIKIDGSTGLFQVPPHYILPNYSIAFWYKLNSLSSVSTNSRIIEFTPGTDLSGSIILYFDTANSGSLSIVVNRNNDSFLSTNYTLDLNWHHICLTYSSGSWILYIDGVSRFTRTYTATSSFLNYCYIGKTTVNSVGNAICNVNQLAIFSKTLTTSDVTTLYNNPKDRIQLSNLMYYYPFDIDFNDYSQIQMSNRSANINSSAGVLQLPAHYINPTGYSISMWFKLNAYYTSTNSRVFDFAPALNGSISGGIVLYFPFANSGLLYFTPFNGTSVVTSIGYTLDLNWHHICVTFSNGNWNICIDGALIYTITYTPTTNLLNYCYIGKSTYNDGDTNCNVRQVAIYQKALSLDEIQFLYSNPNCPINNSNVIPSAVTTSAITNFYPSFPGAYLGVNTKTCLPIYTSLPQIFFNFQQDGAWWILPGFKIIVYGAINYAGTSFTLDNTYGFNNMCKMSDIPSAAKSIRLYYKGQQLLDGGTLGYVNYSANNSIPSIIPYKYRCNNDLDIPIQNNSQTSFPGAWIITSAGSFPIYETMNDLSVMLAGAKDGYYIILPGFKLTTYTSTYLNGTATNYWNDGYSIYNVQPTTSNLTNSVALYYRGQPIVKKRYANPSNMSFGISTRLIVSTYSGPIMNIRRSSDNATSDFYSDKQQTYLTTGANNTGTTYASWIGANTGYITNMYDQSGKGNHCGNTTSSAQPKLSLYNGKYVMQYIRANATCLNITVPCGPNTIFSHFYATDSGYNTIITTPTDYEMRLIYNGNYGDINSGNGADWYFSSTGNKTCYINNTNSTKISLAWNTLCTSVQIPYTIAWGQLFNRVGTDGWSPIDRGLNGYMTEMICHNTEMSAIDMQHYYADQLILTQNAFNVNTPSAYSLNSTYYPSQVQGIWNTSTGNIDAPGYINISYTYQFNYTRSNTGTFYASLDNIGWIIINGGAPTYMGYANWTGGIGVTGSMPIINGINTIEMIGYNTDPSGGSAACFGAFYDSNNTLIAYTNNEWKSKIVNTINQTSLLADPIAGGLWVTTYAFKNTWFFPPGKSSIQPPNYFSNITNLNPVSKQLVSDFSSLGAMKLLVNSNTYTSAWGFKAVGYFVPTSTGTWTFSVAADDVAQVWIGVSSTNAVSINQISNPNVTCWWDNSPQTFSVTVTSGVKYPILIYMGNSPGTINPGSFSISVTTPTSITLSNIFHYMNCAPTY